MSFGVPEEWVDDVRRSDEDTLFDVIKHLPQEAQEALLKLAVGEKPEAPAPVQTDVDPFTHPDAQRRFRILDNIEELRLALDFPWDKWAVFLHPAQRQLVQRKFSGPARVSGSAGTGKTIVALHRAVHLAQSHPEARVLLTTYTKTLAHSLRMKLALLVSGRPDLGSRIEVKPITAVGHDLYSKLFGQPNMASEPDRGTDSLLAILRSLEGYCRANAALLIYVDFSQAQGWRSHAPMDAWSREARIETLPIWPDAIRIDGKVFDPGGHFHLWRERQKEWSEGKSERLLAAQVRAQALRASNLSYERIATTLNEEDLRSATGKGWTGEMVRKLISSTKHSSS